MISSITRALLLNSRVAINKNLVRTCASSETIHMATMPRVKISRAEKLFWYLFMHVVFFSYPAWVTYHVPYYCGMQRETGKTILVNI